MQSSSAQLQTPFLRLAQRESQSYFKSQQQSVARQSMTDTTTLTYGPALAKLKMEADKIRKWKTATQFELKKKESQLSETRQQLEVVQEEVTRVRVREEVLKTQLQDQFSSHTELQHKFLVVRGLCSTLKEKAETVEAALNQARADQNNNSDLDNMRLQQYRALVSKFRDLEQEQNRVQSSLEEALANEREKGRSFEEELTNERVKSQELRGEVGTLQQQLETLSGESEGVRVRLTEVEGKLGEEVKGREAAEELCEQLQKQLRMAQEDCLSLQQTSLALREQVSSQLAESSATEARLQEEVREGEENCQEMEKRLWEQQTTLKQQLAELARAAREKEQLETSLTAIREELCAVEYSRRDDVGRLRGEMREKEEAHSQETVALSSRLTSAESGNEALLLKLKESEANCSAREQQIETLTHSLTQKEAANDGLLTEVEGLRQRERDLKAEGEEREREGEETKTTVSSLSSQLKALQTELEGTKERGGERVQKVEREKSEVEQQLSEVREKLEEAERERERVKKEMDGVRKDCEQETRRCREDAERAKETQTREKESFDAQVTELCGMLERYRNENQKIVQQKEQHIQSLQSSLELARQNKEEMEGLVRGCQGEVSRLAEEVSTLQTELQERQKEVSTREEQVREKDEEMEELLKAVDTLRRKQQASGNIPQSTTHTPLLHTMPRMAPPRSSPLHSSFRPAPKKPRHQEEGEEAGGVARYSHTDCEDVLFRKPRPLAARTSLSALRTPRVPATPRACCPSSVGEVTSTEPTSGGRSERKRQTPHRLQGGRGRKMVGERGKGKKPAAGTAWFDLDAVFGLGPED